MGMIAAGSLDRRIQFERPVTTREPPYNTSKTTWEPHAKVWAQVRDVLPSRAESVDENASMQQRPARIRMRFREDITADMRVIYRGRVMEIVSGPAELGRREALELIVQELSTRGEKP
ncbi:phage head closure protein [Novosphingobium sp.]|uniref:phage head closure protein n=1 Tax=Novosphingobium sp. TaxID=1874826 RepID=UPI003D6CAD24